MFSIDITANRLRHEEMLREAANARLVRIANGSNSLLSRMVKLLACFNRQLQTTVRSERPQAQHPLANAKMS
jgi:hypothetical protein